MYTSIQLPWSSEPSSAELLYRTSGLVKTKGTLYLLPPSTEVLRETFNAPPRARSRMSAGAVALCKHVERGGASTEHGRPHPFWTLPVGSNENKTKIADAILDQMLEDATWRNIIWLHHAVAVYEIRNHRGYGMRWALDLEKVNGLGDEGSEVYHEASGHTSTTAIGSMVHEDQEAGGWMIVQTTFRGFLEPIEGLDHELTSAE